MSRWGVAISCEMKWMKMRFDVIYSFFFWDIWVLFIGCTGYPWSDRIVRSIWPRPLFCDRDSSDIDPYKVGRRPGESRGNSLDVRRTELVAVALWEGLCSVVDVFQLIWWWWHIPNTHSLLFQILQHATYYNPYKLRYSFHLVHVHTSCYAKPSSLLKHFINVLNTMHLKTHKH